MRYEPFKMAGGDGSIPGLSEFLEQRPARAVPGTAPCHPVGPPVSAADLQDARPTQLSVHAARALPRLRAPQTLRPVSSVGESPGLCLGPLPCSTAQAVN